jgi:hypothetical protein
MNEYYVLAVVLAIFVGIWLSLWNLDSKIQKLKSEMEAEHDEHDSR